MFTKAIKLAAKLKMANTDTQTSNTSSDVSSSGLANPIVATTGIKFWDSLPSWSKGVIVVGGLAAIYFGITATLKRIKDAQRGKEARATLEKTEEEIKVLEKQVKPTYPDSQYNAWADSLAKQFSGCDWEDGWGWSGSGAKLYNICYRMENDLDFAKLVSAYGTRSYDQCGFYPFSGDFKGNLTQSVSDELKESEITEINKLLSRRGIRYRFT